MFESVINPKAMLPPPLQLDECFYSATILLPAINETYSLRQTVETVLQASPDDVCQVLIIVCERTTPETMRVAADLASEHSGIVTVHTQRLPFVGGALREGFNLAKGSHVVSMAPFRNSTLVAPDAALFAFASASISSVMSTP